MNLARNVYPLCAMLIAYIAVEGDLPFHEMTQNQVQAELRLVLKDKPGSSRKL